MRIDAAEAQRLLAGARVARLGTVRADGSPHIVPVCFALDGAVAYSAVDAKPKRTTDLQRIRNIARDPRATLLADHYSDDWSQLWWARAEGTARVVAEEVERARAVELLAARYAPYRRQPPDGDVLALDIARWSGWRA